MKISHLLIHLQETMKAHGDLDVIMNIRYDDNEVVESSVESIETEHRICTSREYKNGNVVVLSDDI